MAYYKAGVATRDITPSNELINAGRIWLWGYGGRTVPCMDVRDSLSVRALVIQDAQENTIILVSADLGALDPAMTATVRSRIGARHGVAGGSICINVSHTHGAPVPVTIPTWQLGVANADPEYYAFLTEQLAGVIEDALGQMQAADISWGRGNTDIGQDRHFPYVGLPSTYDSTLDVLKIVNPHAHRALNDHRPAVVAVVFFATCHPVCNGSNNYVYADFPGVARNLIEADSGGTAMFFQGYAGTCNPIDAGPATDLQYVVGERLAADVLSVLNRPLHTLNGPIDAWLQTIHLPFQPLDMEPFADGLARTRANGDDVATGFVERWQAYMLRLGRNIPESLPTQLQAVRIGTAPNQWYLLASSHEVAMDFGPRVRCIWPYPRITVAGYSNSQLSYLPSSYVILNRDVRTAFQEAALVNYEGGWSFVVYGHRGPLTTEVDNLFLQGHIDLLDPGWSLMGHASQVTALAAWNGKLYATTDNDKLWRRDTVSQDIPWEFLGHADGVVGLAAANGLLFCATNVGKLWQRPVEGFDVPWAEIGHAQQVSAMTSLNGVLYAATTNSKLWCRAPVDYDIPWEQIGYAQWVVGMASAEGKLLAVTSDDHLHWREPWSDLDIPWHRFGFAQDVVGMAAIGNTLFVATKEGQLWQRQV